MLLVKATFTSWCWNHHDRAHKQLLLQVGVYLLDFIDTFKRRLPFSVDIVVTMIIVYQNFHHSNPLAITMPFTKKFYLPIAIICEGRKNKRPLFERQNGLWRANCTSNPTLNEWHTNRRRNTKLQAHQETHWLYCQGPPKDLGGQKSGLGDVITSFWTHNSLNLQIVPFLMKVETWREEPQTSFSFQNDCEASKTRK